MNILRDNDGVNGVNDLYTQVIGKVYYWNFHNFINCVSNEFMDKDLTQNIESYFHFRIIHAKEGVLAWSRVRQEFNWFE